MTNYMEEVAKLLGVELNEEFELIFDPHSNCHATVKLTTDGAKVINTNVYDMFNFKSYLLEHLIKGSYGIKRKPWKPRMYEQYWMICSDETTGMRVNDNCPLDIYNYKLGNCYRTEEEAWLNKDKWVEFYRSNDVLKI